MTRMGMGPGCGGVPAGGASAPGGAGPGVGDPAMPWLDDALDVQAAGRALEGVLQGGRPSPGPVDVVGTRLLRCKPGRRALIAYELLPRGAAPGTPPRRVVGKVRARGTDLGTVGLHTELMQRGFAPDSSDGISVPEPLGVMEPWRMWLQGWAPGQTVGRWLERVGGTEGAGEALVLRVLAGLQKLHRSGAPTRRTHTLDDELTILERWLTRAGREHPALRARIDRIGAGCRRLAAALPRSRATGIHRDFHPDQVLVTDTRLHLLDLDLYAWGDPALDIGNFTAHLTELALRTTGDAHSFQTLEATMHEHALFRDPSLGRPSLESWHTLSLARHIGLSTAIAGRADTTLGVIEECERRLARERFLPPLRHRGGGTATARGWGSVLGTAITILALASPSAAQTTHTFTGGADVSSVYDSNINRDRDAPRGLAGLVLTGIFRHRADGTLDLRSEYEVGLHRYAEDTPWNRVSHKLRVDGRLPAGEVGTWGLISELQIRGSGEDRSLGDQLQLEPSFTFEPLDGTELKFRTISRFRRDANGGKEDGHFAGLELEQEITGTMDLEMDLRYEVNRSDSGRRDFSGPRIGAALVTALTPDDELLFELEYRERRYASRMVENDDGDEVLRFDDRWTPRVAWQRNVGGGVFLTLDYEYEIRGSNDPDKRFGTHTIILGAERLW